MWLLFFPYLADESVSVEESLSRSLFLPPALTLWISTAAASLPGDNSNNPKCSHTPLPSADTTNQDEPDISSRAPVQCTRVVKKCLEVISSNLWDGWAEWEGTAEGESVGFHWGDEVAFCCSLPALACSWKEEKKKKKKKKAERRSQIYSQNVGIFL